MDNYSRLKIFSNSNESIVKKEYDNLLDKGFDNLSIRFDDATNEYTIYIFKGTKDILKDELDDLLIMGYQDAKLE